MEKFAHLRVLIVDDEPLIRWSMAETLQHMGCAVTETASAKDTIRELQSNAPPEIVLLDYRLPDSNDLTLLETIRTTAPDARVIMMTAYGTPEVLAGANALGAFRVMNKPVDMADLVAVVEEAQSSRH